MLSLHVARNTCGNFLRFLSFFLTTNRQRIPIVANMVPGGEEYNSLNSSHNSATGGLGGLPAPGSAGGGGGGGNRSNTLLFDTTKNELYRVTENLKTLQRKLKESEFTRIYPAKFRVLVGCVIPRSFSLWPLGRVHAT